MIMGSFIMDSYGFIMDRYGFIMDAQYRINNSYGFYSQVTLLNVNLW